MTTTRGPITLNYNTMAFILDFHTGLVNSIGIIRHSGQKIVEFMIKNQEYYLGFDWKIVSPRGSIKVGDIVDKKLEFVFDKFGRKHSVQNVKFNVGNLGIPESLSIWYDKMLVIEI